MSCLLLLLDINGYFRDLWEETDVTTNPWGIMQNNKSECLRGIIHQALAYPTGLTKQNRETAERLRTVIFGRARTCSGFPQNFPRIRIEAPQFCPQENPLKENLPGPENGSRKKLRISLSNHQKLPGIRSPQGFLYKSPMWVKQCHVYHPPVITINLEVVQGGATPATN